jgi:hypothetical protein
VLVDEATTALKALGVAPALARATALAQALAGVLAS